MLQRDEPGRQADASEPAPSGQADERFYCQTVAELRRTALAVCTALAAESLYFARFGRSYQVPAQPRDLTPATLAELLGGYHEAGAAVHFDSEGRWWVEPSAN